VKQNSLPARPATGYLLIIALALSWSACARLPRQVAADPQLKQDAPGNETSWKININTASARELEKLPGVGEVIAERIVSHRKQHGPFRRAEHLMMVRGISERKFRELQLLITVD
jgi:competence protein ComEA